MTNYVVLEGAHAPLGATLTKDGVNFAVFSQHAQRVTICLFSKDGRREVARLDLPERDGDVWYGFVPGLEAGQMYGLRADGPYAPEIGHRFNYNKLLIDPYAKQLTGHPTWHDSLMGYTVGAPDEDLSFDNRDSAKYMPRCIVVDPGFDWGGDQHPRTPVAQSVIYEAHVKGLTQTMPGVPQAGHFAALGSDRVIEHLTKLGITAIELLPIHAFLNDRFLVEKGLVNYWGYQTLGFFAPEPRYMSGARIAEFQGAVKRLHAAGIEVLLDVVYNHTCEGSELGPTLSFRGLDNRSYYQLADNPRSCINDTGTGNTMNIEHPMVLRMVLDSLRYWVEVMHVDGFRFDLCATLGRTPTGFDRGAAFFDAIRQDPALTNVKLIAEPWDIGPGGYQLGGFPPPFMEWNDQYRDGVRRFWRGDNGHVPELADRLTGSAVQFDHSGRAATSSVNLLTAHDGFTLMDVVSYNMRHNRANGEDNRDGHGVNHSDNMGVEGPTKDKKITAARARRRRNLMATLLLSQGTPMILAGDEIGNTQMGNNNAYCQDNETGWLNWDQADDAFCAFVQKLVAFRHAHPILRQKRFLHSRERAVDGLEDLFWRRADGSPMGQADWDNPGLHVLCAEMRMASGTPGYAQREEALFLVFNAGETVDVTLPPAPRNRVWRVWIDTDAPEQDPWVADGTVIEAPARSVLALVQEAAHG